MFRSTQAVLLLLLRLLRMSSISVSLSMAALRTAGPNLLFTIFDALGVICGRGPHDDRFLMVFYCSACDPHVDVDQVCRGGEEVDFLAVSLHVASSRLEFPNCNGFGLF